jgi:hypothetical protein
VFDHAVVEAGALDDPRDDAPRVPLAQCSHLADTSVTDFGPGCRRRNHSD